MRYYDRHGSNLAADCAFLLQKQAGLSDVNRGLSGHDMGLVKSLGTRIPYAGTGIS